MAHPTSAIAVTSRIVKRKSAPVCGSGPGGRPHSASSVSLAIEGDGAPTRRCLDCSRLEWSGREASRPAPCGAPTRHLGLYAFDRGRTGPAPSGRRGCPSTARGRGCVLHRSQVPLPLPTFKTPHECAPRRVDRDGLRIVTLQVKSSIIFTGGVFLYGE